eukprot:366226-Chlamydomonas_euryale.AAC.25
MAMAKGIATGASPIAWPRGSAATSPDGIIGVGRGAHHRFQQDGEHRRLREDAKSLGFQNARTGGSQFFASVPAPPPAALTAP